MPAHVVPSSYLVIDDIHVKFERETGYVDALDVFSILTNTVSAAHRLTSSKFKPFADGVKRVRWDAMSGGHGRLAVRHDVMSKVLLTMKGGKTTAAKKAAEAIAERFIDFNTDEQQVADKPQDRTSKCATNETDQSPDAFIYGLFSEVHNRIMYTGRTLSPEERMKQHGFASSKCRLVRQAFQEHGSANFSMRIIISCSLDDAKRNESMWIIKNNTMYPGGYNLVHGSNAGHVGNDCETISTGCTSSFTFDDSHHERRVVFRACSDLQLEMMGEAKSLLDDQKTKSKRLVDNEVLEDKIKRAKGLGDEELVNELRKRFLGA